MTSFLSAQAFCRRICRIPPVPAWELFCLRLSERPGIRAVIDDHLCPPPAVIINPFCISCPEADTAMRRSPAKLIIIFNTQGRIACLSVHDRMKQISLLNSGTPLAVAVSVEPVPAIFRRCPRCCDGCRIPRGAREGLYRNNISLSAVLCIHGHTIFSLIYLDDIG